ncbi:MAG TPA: hypothetical protein VGM54_02280 [Chthoniobacter sp.]|jgi:hypothetical protein
MKVSTFLIIVLLSVIAYRLFTTNQPQTFFAAPPTPAPAAAAYAPQPSPTPSGNWMNDPSRPGAIASTPFDETGRKRNHWTRH